MRSSTSPRPSTPMHDLFNSNSNSLCSVSSTVTTMLSQRSETARDFSSNRLGRQEFLGRGIRSIALDQDYWDDAHARMNDSDGEGIAKVEHVCKRPG
ncbi:hypothetical protein CH63R_01915 [Colletotrichum higginsianum IMI 349063]|uniref:Uncharacterized protein n=1 Tax=Colletotrichum higginsianum (strain IMI 349063) TaxID=759273 RepID=A0A1B7YMD1_COLHI|nr:hypothetical protein CH63R_01915 [Colletotrichum higginsianum IMI 349063]OBR13189.1 hypothetical protein CH63R_01915 [Colletotrichum higginsianum IMI 349063]